MTPAEVGIDTYRKLQRLAREQGRPTDEYLQLYTLEGFLARLAQSVHRDTFVLKGGVLLAAYDVRRPTRDIDIQAEDLDNAADTVRDVVASIAALAIDDGLEFVTDEAAAEVIRDEDEYSGVRVSIPAHLATARLKLKVDVNIGDPISPGPQDVDIPRLLSEDVITLRGYPLHMVHAEKVVTAYQRGIANTRWRDYYDMFTLASAHGVDGDAITLALREVSKYRQASPVALAEALEGYAEVAQDRWGAWRRKYQLEDALPEQFQEVIDAVSSFADPAIVGDVTGKSWDPAEWAWQEA